MGDLNDDHYASPTAQGTHISRHNILIKPPIHVFNSIQQNLTSAIAGSSGLVSICVKRNA
ncbi:hypothetical protein P5673_017627 [Acropora cervicornis]|uniref:Uncharacterized protein n=1 Tax=Acropora cervicornis TaxID=6130 RepID=A0AAD9QE09_ACRCE|nr:hypothetical protein P5673_017627 [Acropora cervicornis]